MIINLRNQKHSHAHIEASITHINTVCTWGKHTVKNPQLSIYYIDWEHVTIHSTILLTSTQYYLHMLHIIQLRSNLQISSAACMPLLRHPVLGIPARMNPQVKIMWAQATFHWASTTQSSLAYSIHACEKSHAQLTAVSPFHLPLTLVSTELSMHWVN